MCPSGSKIEYNTKTGTRFSCSLGVIVAHPCFVLLAQDHSERHRRAHETRRRPTQQQLPRHCLVQAPWLLLRLLRLSKADLDELVLEVGKSSSPRRYNASVSISKYPPRSAPLHTLCCFLPPLLSRWKSSKHVIPVGNQRTRPGIYLVVLRRLLSKKRFAIRYCTKS